jgi:GntR family transcriptional regulator
MKKISLPLRSRMTPSDAIRAAGAEPGLRVLSSRTCQASETASKLLTLRGKASVEEISALRFADGVPVAWVTAWIPADRVVGFREVLELTGCFTFALKAKRVYLRERRLAQVSAYPAGPEEMELLGVARHSPIIRIQAVVDDRGNEPTIASDTRYDARCVELLIDNPGPWMSNRAPRESSLV